MTKHRITGTHVDAPLRVLVILTMLLGTGAFGQERSGTLVGMVADQTKAAIPDVTVTVTNKATNRVFVAKTRGDGNYVATELEPGRYSVRFERTGFAKFEVPDVIVLVGETLERGADRPF